MRSSLDGERMMMPEMDARQPTLVPPSPYSIAPLGYDVSPAAPAAKRSVVLGAFGTGALFGGLMMGAVVLAWHAAHPPQESAAAVIAAHPAAPACVPLPTLAGAAPATALAADVPSGAAAPTPASAPDTNAPSGSPSTKEAAAPRRGTAAPKRSVAHKAKEAKVGGLAASSNDDAFMKAIRASSH
jgi:hypothetical protein